VSPDAIAYLLFTSGSTGEPKGVPISHANVRAYIRHICDRFQVNEHDRFSQMFDLTFDLSVHDMFVCWERGACLYSVPETSLMAPAKFVKDHCLTMWFSVPSAIGLMAKMGMLKPRVFPSLRVSLFCGEPLPSVYASAWQEAAPNSVIENLYGPTETTIAITSYRWDPESSPSACVNGIVPIGWVFDGQQACVIDHERNPVPIGERGELCLSGSQVTRGYWENPRKTAEQLVRLRSFGERVWYRTGDLVRQDQSGCFYYLGRIDHQVKIRGYRVELQEVEFVLRKASGSGQVAAVAWPVREGIAEGIVAFIGGRLQCDANAIVRYCREALPDYMVPRQIHVLDALPLNENGKLDRFKLIKMLEGQGAEHGT
jgi:amino acid adenylation domain-containing protein